MVEVNTYTGEYHREGDGWVAEVTEVPQVHTYGRTLPKTQEYLREALALVLDVEADSFELLTKLHIAKSVDKLVARALKVREQAEVISADAKQATATAAVALVEQGGLRRRDAAAALGLSFQRVDQIVSERQTLAV